MFTLSTSTPLAASSVSLAFCCLSIAFSMSNDFFAFTSVVLLVPAKLPTKYQSSPLFTIELASNTAFSSCSPVSGVTSYSSDAILSTSCFSSVSKDISPSIFVIVNLPFLALSSVPFHISPAVILISPDPSPKIVFTF